MVKLKEVMKEKGVSRYALAKRSGLNYRTLIAIENGGDVKISTLIKIAKILDVEVRDLF